MIDTNGALARCQELVALACKQGADAAEAAMRGESSESVSVRLGKLEDVSRSESEGIGLRVFVGRRSATIQTSDFSEVSFAVLVERALEMARRAPEDPYAGLAPEELLYRGETPDLDLFDPAEPAPAQLREWAEATEDAARAVAGVTNSNGGGASSARSVGALATSHGVARTTQATGFSLSASVIAGEGATMQTDHAWRSARHAADLPEPDVIGREAAERAVKRVSPGSLSGKMPVIFDPRIGSGLLGHLLGAMNGGAVARKSSFLIGHEDEDLFDSAIRVIEDPLRRRGLASRAVDGEGLQTQRRALVEGGRIFGWTTNAAAARQLGAPMTGHASRGVGGAPGISTGNVHMEAGDLTPAELMEDIADGLYVTDLFGQGVSLVTGDYSRGAAGFRIVDGHLAGPVAEITIASNLLQMFRALTPANDLEFHRGLNVPTLRVDGMMVAGA